MGDVIRASAAVDDIFADARSAHTEAISKGGKVQSLAEEILGPALGMVGAFEDDLKAARATLVPLAAAVNAENERADAEINRIYDETWNDVGRPAYDRYLTLMYPNGAVYYTDGDTVGQPARMELLAKLYDRKLHPKLSAEQCAAFAARVRTAAAALKADLDAAADPTITVVQLERVRTALGRVAQYELANFKRALKIAGLSEAKIHEIIPDRPAAKKAAKKDDGPAAPPAPPAPPADPK